MIRPSLDPSDLVSLSVLLSERHVTRAAKRLGVTQSTMSYRLGHLRRAFDDELLVRHGRDMLLTPRAKAMLRPLEEALLALDGAVRGSSEFTPGITSFQATLALPDLLAPYLPGLFATLLKAAPGLALDIVPVPGNLPDALASGRPCLAVGPVQLGDARTVARSLGTLPFAVLSRRGHPVDGSRLTVKRWLSYPHVVVSIGSPSKNIITEHLKKRGLKRTVALSVPGFLPGLLCVAESELLMNAPLPLVQRVVTRLGLCVHALPLSLPSVRLSLMWHPLQQRDAAHGWLRARVFEYFTKIIAGR